MGIIKGNDVRLKINGERFHNETKLKVVSNVDSSIVIKAEALYDVRLPKNPETYLAGEIVKFELNGVMSIKGIAVVEKAKIDNKSPDEVGTIKYKLIVLSEDK